MFLSKAFIPYRSQVSALRPPQVCPAATEMEMQAPLMLTSAISMRRINPDPMIFQAPPYADTSADRSADRSGDADISGTGK